MEQLKIFIDTAYYNILNPEKGLIKGQGINDRIAEWVKKENIIDYRIVNASVTSVEKGEYVLYAIFVAYTV